MDMDTLRERFLTHLRAGRNASPYTVKNYGNDIGQFLDYCKAQGVGRLSQVDRSLLRSYLAELDGVGYVRASIARRVAELRSFGDFLVQEEVWEHNPFRLVSAPRQSRHDPNLYPRQSEPGAGGLYAGASAGWDLGFVLGAALW